MSKTEILDQLPKLNSSDRMEIFSLLYDLEEKEILLSILPSPEEKFPDQIFHTHRSET